MRNLIGALILASTVGCSTIPNLEQRFEKSQEIVARRSAQIKGMSLEEKTLIFEKRLDDFIPRADLGLISPDSAKFAEKIIYTETSAVELFYLSAKYGATGDGNVKKRMLNLVKGFKELDKSNTYDGFLPFKAIIGEEISPSDCETHANVYSQLLGAYAYALTVSDSSELNEEILSHVKEISKYFIKNDFDMHDQNGKRMKYSDMKPLIAYPIQNNIRMLIYEMGLLTGDPVISSSFLKDKEKLDRKMDSSVMKSKLSLGPIVFPTHSSVWLDMVKLTALSMITDNPRYERAIEKRLDVYSDQVNPLFITMSLLANPSRKDFEFRKKKVIDYLQTCPIQLDNSEIINSPRKEVSRRSPRWIKFYYQPEARVPLPVYERPLDMYGFKHDQQVMDGNFGKSGKVTYTGVDYLWTYWMLQHAERKRTNLMK